MGGVLWASKHELQWGWKERRWRFEGLQNLPGERHERARCWWEAAVREAKTLHCKLSWEFFFISFYFFFLFWSCETISKPNTTPCLLFWIHYPVYSPFFKTSLSSLISHHKSLNGQKVWVNIIFHVAEARVDVCIVPLSVPMEVSWRWVNVKMSLFCFWLRLSVNKLQTKSQT